MLRIYLIILVTLFASSIIRANTCDYWIAKIDPKAAKVGDDLNEGQAKNILEGIDCLLKQEGRKEPGILYGSKPNVSQFVPKASVEINVLYQISLLFSGNDDFAQAIALTKVGDDHKFNSDRIVKKAYASYRKWFKKVKKVGLEESRKQKLDPLAYSGVEWY